MNFIEKYLKAVQEKDSVLCLGLDPKPPLGQKPDDKSVAKIAEYCKQMVEKTSGSCCAVKANLQFIFPFSLHHYREINRSIHAAGMVSILDIKLNDIGSSNAASIFWIKEAGFDALTFSPFAGNVSEGIGLAHENGLGIFVLTLMSNPESKYFMKGEVEGIPAYRWISHQVAQARGDGVVVGATQKGREIEEIRDLVGNGTIFLIPGIGAQGGDEDVLRKAGGNLLVNVGRSVLNAEDPAKEAEQFRQRFNLLRR